MELQGIHLVYTLVGRPLGDKDSDLPPREIDVTGIPLYELQRIFHAGPNNKLLERRLVNDEKASRLQAFCSEQINTDEYRWELTARWSDHPQ